MLFTAASYGKMSGAYPAAGSTYTYAQRALNPHVGFLRATRFSPLLVLTRDLSSIARKQDLRRSATAQAVDYAWRSFSSSNLVRNDEGSAVLLLQHLIGLPIVNEVVGAWVETQLPLQSIRDIPQ